MYSIVKELVDASFLPSFSIAAVEKARLSILRWRNQCHAYLSFLTCGWIIICEGGQVLQRYTLKKKKNSCRAAGARGGHYPTVLCQYPNTSTVSLRSYSYAELQGMPRSPKGDPANKRFEPRGSAENLLVPECSNRWRYYSFGYRGRRPRPWFRQYERRDSSVG